MFVSTFGHLVCSMFYFEKLALASRLLIMCLAISLCVQVCVCAVSMYGFNSIIIHLILDFQIFSVYVCVLSFHFAKSCVRAHTLSLCLSLDLLFFLPSCTILRSELGEIRVIACCLPQHTQSHLTHDCIDTPCNVYGYVIVLSFCRMWLACMLFCSLNVISF